MCFWGRSDPGLLLRLMSGAGDKRSPRTGAAHAPCMLARGVYFWGSLCTCCDILRCTQCCLDLHLSRTRATGLLLRR